MWRIVKIQALPEFRLEVWFEDGVHGFVDLREDLWGPMLEPLKDPAFFAQVGLDEFGAPCWPNGADIAPDAIYDDLTRGHAAEC